VSGFNYNRINWMQLSASLFCCSISVNS